MPDVGNESLIAGVIDLTGFGDFCGKRVEGFAKQAQERYNRHALAACAPQGKAVAACQGREHKRNVPVKVRQKHIPVGDLLPSTYFENRCKEIEVQILRQ